MIIKSSVWELIKADFSEEDKFTLSQAVTGYNSNPEAWLIDVDELPLSLATKVLKFVEDDFLKTEAARKQNAFS